MAAVHAIGSVFLAMSAHALGRGGGSRGSLTPGSGTPALRLRHLRAQGWLMWGTCVTSHHGCWAPGPHPHSIEAAWGHAPTVRGITLRCSLGGITLGKEVEELALQVSMILGKSFLFSTSFVFFKKMNLPFLPEGKADQYTSWVGLKLMK